MISKLTAALTLPATTVVPAAGPAAATEGEPGTALTRRATYTHDDEIVIEVDAPAVYAQARYQPGQHQQIRCRTVIVDGAQGALSGAGERETGTAGVTEPAEMDGTEIATGYLIKDGRTELGVFDSCQ
ncbi:hypothetical protein [Nocardia sp. NBC_00416]|uniref:hypothetical protein n=1 Tax=Nocardia sp. NBC_00416 TaxID=2975991 RepID=UPI002E1E28DE